MSDPSPYELWKKEQDGLPAIAVFGASASELNVIRAALNLYRTRNAEKETERPGCGFGAQAGVAESIAYRLR